MGFSAWTDHITALLKGRAELGEERGHRLEDAVEWRPGDGSFLGVACLPGDPGRILMQMGASHSHADAVQFLRDEFRRHLDVFYARLKLAPPYHSVEKAIMHLTTALQGMVPEERERIAADPALQWEQYRRAFVDSGLHHKHRGIIARLVRSPLTADLPAEHKHFLEAFKS